jgi:regulator of cell morphogenesis and NO signaling
MKIAPLINENPQLLLFLEHLNIDFVVGEKNMEQICIENNLSLPVFLMLANLYNGFHPKNEEIASLEDISMILRFLKKSHDYYKNEKYPEIKGCIKMLQEKHANEEVVLIEQFFYDYFNEVLEHLDYEDKTAFPYFISLIEEKNDSSTKIFSVNEYREHHTDIETKLTDLKNLLLKHIRIENELVLRRKMLMALFELEFDLHIHSLIEEAILLPLVDRIEKQRTE